MHAQAKSCIGASTFDQPNQIVRDLHLLIGRNENEIVWPQCNAIPVPEAVILRHVDRLPKPALAQALQTARD